MKRAIYWLGIMFQAGALLALPSAIWITEFRRNEREALTVFIGSIFVFVLGAIMARK